ncbi:MAG: glycosyltransferase [Patescibacteria group bacterium]|nr:glycosyltransferase [Patescibacteria group bacterium]
MTICFFGIYDPLYSRNSILIKGLKQNGIEVIECNATAGRIGKYLTLIAKHRQIRKKYDFMIVAFPGYQAVILAKFLTLKPVIYDAFFSIYDSEVCDRKSTKTGSLKALYYWILDWLACLAADKIMLDTSAHIDYFCRLFRLKKEKFIRVLLGADDQLIKFTRPEAKENLIVHFHGIATPLQGVGYIVEAARLLKQENIKFNLVGSKIRRYEIKGDEANINYIKTLPYPELIKIMAEADICLGIFGNSMKTQVVIPNKIYEALAGGKAVITADTKAVREVLADKQNCLFCRIGDPRDLADKIIMLKRDEKLRQQIAENGYQLFIDKLTPIKVTADLAERIKQGEFNKKQPVGR